MYLSHILKFRYMFCRSEDKRAGSVFSGNKMHQLVGIGKGVCRLVDVDN